MTIMFSATAINLVPAAAATDIFTLTGAAGVTVRVLAVMISGTAGTAISPVVQLIQRSTLNTGGTTVNLAEIPFDPALPGPAQASAVSYTINPSALGVSVGPILASALTLPVSGGLASPLAFPVPANGIVLRGAAQSLAINLNGSTIATGSLTISIIWTEQ